MKTLKELNFKEIRDESALTIIGGSGCGTATETVVYCGALVKRTGDWNDEGCCEN